MKMRVLKKDGDELKTIRWRIAAIGVAAMLFIAAAVFIPFGAQATDYTFGSEQVDYGSTSDQSNRNAEDSAYETITETDQQTDTNYTTSSESVTTGTPGGDNLPDSIGTDDSSYRSYTEADCGVSPYDVFIVPDADTSVNWNTVYPSGSHYAQLDDSGTADTGDGSSTYVSTTSASDIDIFTMSDISEPEGGYNIDVTLYAVHQKDAAQPCNFEAGIRISTTNYQGMSLNPTNGVWKNTSSSTWTTNPATSSEWTWSDVCGLSTYITTSDASPEVYCTKVVVKVSVSFTTSYCLEAQLTYSTSAGTHTTGWKLLVQGYRSGSEDFYVQVWDTVAEGWNTRITIAAGSDTDYSWTLTADERSGGGDVVSRVIDPSGDATQDTVYFDIWKVQRIDEEYMASVQFTATSLPLSGDLEFRLKGYCDDGETWNLDFWNYTTTSWDTKFTMTELSNYQYTFDIYYDSYVDSQTMKCRVDNQDSPDTDQSEFYIDYLCVRTTNQPPVVSDYGHNPADINYGETLHFWCVYTDAENDAPDYVRAVIESTPYAMTKNDSEDVDYTDGCAYYLDKSDLATGDYGYYYAASDGNNPEQTTTPDSFTVNTKPTLTQDGHSPPTGNNGDYFDFWCIYTDLDNDAPSYLKVDIEGTPYDLAKNGTDDDYTDGCAYYVTRQLPGGLSDYYFYTEDWLSGVVQTSSDQVDVNNKPTLGSYDRQPGDPCYPTTEVTFSVTYTDIDNDAPASIKWREGGGTIQNITMTKVSPADEDYTDGCDYEVSVYLSHGEHSFDFYASDGMGTVSGGSDSITIGNRDPVIGNDPGTPTTYRNVYWEYDFDATDADEDTIGWEMSTNCTELSINPSSGLVYGTMSDDAAIYWVYVYANDSYSGSDSFNFDLTVVNRAPVIDSTGNTTQAVNSFLCYHVLYHDDDSDECGLEYATNMTGTSTENFYINGTTTALGWFWFKVWVNDSYGGSDLEEFDLTVTNTVPYFTSTPVYTIANNTFYEYDSDATDPEGQEIVYTLNTNCTPLNIGSENGTVWGTPEFVGSYWVNVTATDPHALFAWQNFSLSVTNTAPSITSTPSNTTLWLGVAWEYDCDATDANGDTLYYDLVSPSPAFLFIDHDTGVVQGTGNVEGPFTVKISVYDGYTTVYQQFGITVYEGGEEPEEPSPEPSPDVDDTYGLLGLIPLIVIMAVIIAVGSMFHKKRRGQQK